MSFIPGACPTCGVVPEETRSGILECGCVGKEYHAPTPEERLPFTCPSCFAPLNATRSVLMNMRINTGHATCIRCKEFLHLEIIPDLYGKEMTATKWNDYLARKHGKA